MPMYKDNSESIGRTQSTGNPAEDQRRQNDATPIYRRLEVYSNELRLLFSNPPPPDDAEREARVLWDSLAGRLTADASAKLEE